MTIRKNCRFEENCPPHPELVRHFEERTRLLPIVKTTRTPSGQILDWISRESQHPRGEVATPPPNGAKLGGEVGRPPLETHPARESTFELEQEGVERGPPGTVPIVRKDLSRLHAGTPLRVYLAKGRGKRRAVSEALRRGDPVADPDPFGYFHGMTSADGTCFGAEAQLNVWDPSLENAGDH
jgi:hypothetical protein